jgi:hypothetical protein
MQGDRFWKSRINRGVQALFTTFIYSKETADERFNKLEKPYNL